MNTRNNKSLKYEAHRHVYSALLAACLICAVIAALLWVFTIKRLSALEADNAKVRINQLITQMEHQWQIQAEAVASNIGFMRLTEGSDKWIKLRSYIVSQGEGLGFDAVEVYDRNSRKVFSSGYERDWFIDYRRDRSDSWLFNEKKHILYRVLDVPVWLGSDGAGRMFLFKHMDNSVLSTLAQSSKGVFLIKDGLVIASSEGNAMLGKSPPSKKGIARQILSPETHVRIDIGSGAGIYLLSVVPIYAMQHVVFYILVMLFFSALLLFAVWLALGRWGAEVIARITALSDATRVFGKTHVVDDMTGQALSRAAGEMDEVTELQAALRTLMNKSEARDREMREHENSLRAAMANLERSNRELEQFAYVASHDLQQPLRGISGFAQLLNMRYKEKLGDEASEFITYIVQGVERMYSLINDLLTYSRITTRQKPFQIFDSAAAVEDALVNLKGLIDETGAVIDFDNLPAIYADDTQIMQVFQNLIGNAIKYRGEGKPLIKISASMNGDEWVFSIADNGIGFEMEQATRIFEMFQRLHSDSSYEGTGIGLAICKKIIERHGGRIWAESQVGKGSVFYFTIPIHAEKGILFPHNLTTTPLH
jgi:signal transduction histidine kinase